MSMLKTLAEGIENRSAKDDALRLVKKWEKFGLLEGLDTHAQRAHMSLLLENQTKQLLKEASTMAGGNVQGFSQVAFPLVRRIFGRAIANKLVSVQPMSLPAGLIFFLDFTYDTDRLDYAAGDSIYGDGVLGSQVTAGVSSEDDGDIRYGEDGFRAMNNGYSHATGTLAGLTATEVDAPFELGPAANNVKVENDPDLASGSYATKFSVTLTDDQINNILVKDNLIAIEATLDDFASGSTQVRRLTRRSGNTITFVYHGTASFSALFDDSQTVTIGFPRQDAWSTPHLGAIEGASPWELEFNAEIPEINIQVDSIPITAQTRKLKAKWTPELAQDLNAFHSLDAEVELSSVLADHIELEINAELMTELVRGGTAARYFWSRRPGKFVDRATGADLSSATDPPDFTGNVSEWYQTLMEILNDVSAQIHRKVRKGGANFLVCSPDVASVLEMTNGFRASVAVDADDGDAGVVSVGSIKNKWDVYVDALFFRNVILIGRKGSGFLESGYVYSPYVPLQTTPTIYGPEDFVPRKGVSTRYARKMVNPDYYGVVIVQDLLG